MKIASQKIRHFFFPSFFFSSALEERHKRTQNDSNSNALPVHVASLSCLLCPTAIGDVCCCEGDGPSRRRSGIDDDDDDSAVCFFFSCFCPPQPRRSLRAPVLDHSVRVVGACRQGAGELIFFSGERKKTIETCLREIVQFIFQRPTPSSPSSPTPSPKSRPRASSSPRSPPSGSATAPAASAPGPAPRKSRSSP